MMAELCYHLIDLVQNSAAAGADEIHVLLKDSAARDDIILEIRDNGRGMDEEMVNRVQDPFFTTKSIKKVGLGIPLLKETALMCEGTFSIDSRAGEGTCIRAQLCRSHIDTPPLGDVSGTFLTLLTGHSQIQVGETDRAINIQITYMTDAVSFEISSADIRGHIGDLPFTHPEVIAFLRGFIDEKTVSLKA